MYRIYAPIAVFFGALTICLSTPIFSAEAQLEEELFRPSVVEAFCTRSYEGTFVTQLRTLVLQREGDGFTTNLYENNALDLDQLRLQLSVSGQGNIQHISLRTIESGVTRKTFSAFLEHAGPRMFVILGEEESAHGDVVCDLTVR